MPLKIMIPTMRCSVEGAEGEQCFVKQFFLRSLCDPVFEPSLVLRLHFHKRMTSPPLPPAAAPPSFRGTERHFPPPCHPLGKKTWGQIANHSRMCACFPVAHGTTQQTMGLYGAPPFPLPHTYASLRCIL